MLTSIIPTHKVAQWLLVHIHRLLDYVGLEKDQGAEDIIYIAIIVAVALALGWLARKLTLYATKKIMLLRNNDLAQDLMQHHVLMKCSHIIPPLVLLALLPFAFTTDSLFKDIVFKALLIYTVIVICMAACRVVHFTWMRFDKKRNTKNLPLKGIMGTVVGVLWVIAVIICVSILVDKSPVALLTGLGAFAAVLMLVFKDSILGLVAGLQLSENDMLHVGDWIVVPGTPANGTVQDVSLSAVKIRNFDNTFVTVPPYTLVSGSFQNYRGMKEAGARRLDPSLTIAMSSVSRCTPDMIDKALAAHPEIKPFVDKLQKADSTVAADPGIRPLNGTTETNLGLFRAYAAQYLLTSPLINHDMQVLVRILEPTDNGLPLQFYCFAHTTDWNEYEAIRSTVIENFTVAAADFGLEIYYGGSYDITTVNADTDADTGTTADDTKKA